MILQAFGLFVFLNSKQKHFYRFSEKSELNLPSPIWKSIRAVNYCPLKTYLKDHAAENNADIIISNAIQCF